jgi:DHA2 family multidrug resistance protein
MAAAAEAPRGGARPPSGASGGPYYTGGMRIVLTLVLALANLMEVLDITIANVSIPTICGELGASTSQGAWIITSYSVANAITVPVTGWLADRIGQVRLFTSAIVLFTISSFLCAISVSLPMLIAFRVMQGAVAGFMIPLSQSLMMMNYPPEKRSMALAIWAMTVTVGPIIGPILGGWITSNFHWSWIFLINIPIGLFAALGTWQLLSDHETPTHSVPVDFVGIALLVVWVGSLQILLDKGNELDWFGSPVIVSLAITAVIGFTFFVIWELHDPHPIVDLSLFRIRNYTLGVITMSLGFALFFGMTLLLPLWLQTQMGYTSEWAGFVMAPAGVLAVVLSPVVGKTMSAAGPRLYASIGIGMLGILAFMRSHFTTESDYWTITTPQALQGIGIAFFFAPLIAISLGGIPNHRIARAAGLQNFMRMMAGSFGASIIIAAWDHRQALHHTRLAERLPLGDPQVTRFVESTAGAGFAGDQSHGLLENLLSNQAYMLATNDIFWLCGVLFLCLVPLIWTTRPPFAQGAGGGGH